MWVVETSHEMSVTLKNTLAYWIRENMISFMDWPSSLKILAVEFLFQRICKGFYPTLFFTPRASLVAQTVHLPAIWESRVWSLGREDPLEKEMAIHSSILAWKISRMESGRLQSTGSQRVGHDWATSLHFTYPTLLCENEWNNLYNVRNFRLKDGELKTNMFSIWDSIGLFRELNVIPSKPWLKLIGHQSSILSKAGDCMLRCIIRTLPIYWSITYLSLYLHIGICMHTHVLKNSVLCTW